MLGTLISAIIGGGGGFLGGLGVESLTNLSSGGLLGNLTGPISGVLGGSAVAGLMRHGGDETAAGDAAGGGINPKQILGSLAGGMGAGAIGQSVLSLLT